MSKRLGILLTLLVAIEIAVFTGTAQSQGNVGPTRYGAFSIVGNNTTTPLTVTGSSPSATNFVELRSNDGTSKLTVNQSGGIRAAATSYVGDSNSAASCTGTLGVCQNSGASIGVRTAQNGGTGYAEWLSRISYGTVSVPLMGYASGDNIFDFRGDVWDSGAGTYLPVVSILAEFDGATAAGDLPTRLSFWTTPDGTNSYAERQRIGNAGKFTFGTSQNTNDAYYVFYSDSDTANFTSVTSTTEDVAGFASTGSTGAPGVVLNTDSTSQGVFFMASTANANTSGDQVFWIQENDDTAYGTLTRKGWSWQQNGSEQAFMTRGGELHLNNDGTTGTDGNVPHACQVRSNTVSSTSTTVDCASGEILTGGGCNGSNAMLANYPLDSDTWSCQQTSSATIIAYGICCDY